MQKKLIALAVAAAAGSAFAQTNVTIYGVADATFDSIKANAFGATAEIKRDNRVSSNSSYIGFKGVEDLGNGLKALFQIENGINTDNGAAGAWNNRDTFVGLTGGFGTVLAGNLTAAARGLGARMDVNAGATGVGYQGALYGRNGTNVYAAGATVSNTTGVDDRTNNAIAYVTPNFAGFSAVVALGAGAEAKTTVDNVYSLGLNYANGGIDLGYAYTGIDNYNTAADARSDRIGAGYTFGTNKVTLVWDRTDADTSSANNKRSAITLAGKFGVTAAGSVIAGFGKASDLDGTTNTGAKHLFLGYEHSLSKRTVLKAIYARVDNSAGAAYNFYNGSTGAIGATGATLGAGQDISALQIGVRHSF